MVPSVVQLDVINISPAQRARQLRSSQPLLGAALTEDPVVARSQCIDCLCRKANHTWIFRLFVANYKPRLGSCPSGPSGPSGPVSQLVQPVLHGDFGPVIIQVADSHAARTLQSEIGWITRSSPTPNLHSPASSCNTLHRACQLTVTCAQGQNLSGLIGPMPLKILHIAVHAASQAMLPFYPEATRIPALPTWMLASLGSCLLTNRSKTHSSVASHDF